MKLDVYLLCVRASGQNVNRVFGNSIILDYLKRNEYVVEKILWIGRLNPTNKLTSLDGVTVLTYGKHHEAITNAYPFFSKKKALIITHDTSRRLMLWDLKKNNTQYIASLKDVVKSPPCIAFSKGGRHIAVEWKNQFRTEVISIIRLRDKREKEINPNQQFVAGIKQLYLSSGNRYLIVVSNPEYTMTRISTYLTNLKTQDPASELSNITFSDGDPMDATISRDHSLIAILSEERKLHILHEPFDGNSWRTHQLNDKWWPKLIRFSPNNQNLLTDDSQGGVAIYNLTPTDLTYEKNIPLFANQIIRSLKMYSEELVATSKSSTGKLRINVANLKLNQQKAIVMPLYQEPGADNNTDSALKASSRILDKRTITCHTSERENQLDVYRWRQYDIVSPICQDPPESQPQPGLPWWKRFIPTWFSRKNIIRLGALGLGAAILFQKYQSKNPSFLRK